MMSCIYSISCPSQGSLIRSHMGNHSRFSSSHGTPYTRATCLYASPSIASCQLKVCSILVHNVQKGKRSSPVCASGKKGNSTGGNEPFSWESVKKVFGGFRRELTVQDMLREKARQKQFDGNGYDGISGGGSGGSGRGRDSEGSGGPGDEGFAGQLDEFLQVIMGVFGVVFLYILMIRGEELTRLARDYIKYLFGAKPSVRLERTMKKWRKFYDSIVWIEKVEEDWLERKIVSTPTWWHKPRKLAYLVESQYENYMKQKRMEALSTSENKMATTLE